jgi:Rrf2 family protein
MLCLSQTTGYAILALSCLDSCESRWVLAKDIARCTGISLPYLSKMLHALGGSGLIEAKRGYRGGFRLARAADRISLLAVAEAVEGGDWLSRCLLGLEECSDQRACPTHQFWKTQRQDIQRELQRLSLCDVAQFERAHGRRLGTCACGDQS